MARFWGSYVFVGYVYSLRCAVVVLCAVLGGDRVCCLMRFLVCLSLLGFMLLLGLIHFGEKGRLRAYRVSDRMVSQHSCSHVHLFTCELPECEAHCVDPTISSQTCVVKVKSSSALFGGGAGPQQFVDNYSCTLDPVSTQIGLKATPGFPLKVYEILGKGPSFPRFMYMR